jgi:superfamily I DNA/RNA helicase
LLKRFPLAAGINPDAEVDDKDVRGDDLFTKLWPVWLRSELASRSPRRDEWLQVLEDAAMGDISKLARRLCDFDVPLASLPLTDDHSTLAIVTGLLNPFAGRLRANALSKGYLSNNALLVLARDLLANNLTIRETLKREIAMIFVDEFQDTDPLQGELLLFLAEKGGDRDKRWQDVKLAQ